MKITTSNLQFIITLIVFRLFLLLVFVYKAEDLVQTLNLHVDALTYRYFLSTSIDIFLFIFLFYFLNNLLEYKKVNLLLMITIGFRSIFLIVEILKFQNIVNEQIVKIIYPITGTALLVTTILFCFSIFKYKGTFRRQIILYSCSQFIVMMIQILTPLAMVFLTYEMNLRINFFAELSGVLVYLALLLLYYKASISIQETDEADTSYILDR